MCVSTDGSWIKSKEDGAVYDLKSGWGPGRRAEKWATDRTDDHALGAGENPELDQEATFLVRVFKEDVEVSD